MAFPPHVSPASLKRDHIDVLTPYVGPLYISMCVKNAQSVRGNVHWSVRVNRPVAPLTKHHGYFKSNQILVSLSARFYLFVCVCPSLCVPLFVCLSLVYIVEWLLVLSRCEEKRISHRCRKQLDQPCYCKCLPP